MEYWGHVATNGIVAGAFSICYLFLKPTSYDPLILFWAGAIPFTFIITCDLDSDKSIVRQLWGPFKFIWKPFVNAGHREILHDPFWGPYILISIVWIPLTVYGVHVRLESIAGAVCMIETHIWVDHGYSGYKKVVKFLHKILPF